MELIDLLMVKLILNYYKENKMITEKLTLRRINEFMPYNITLSDGINLYGAIHDTMRISRRHWLHNKGLSLFSIQHDDYGKYEPTLLKEDCLVNFLGEFIILEKDDDINKISSLLKQEKIITIKDYDFRTTDNFTEIISILKNLYV